MTISVAKTVIVGEAQVGKTCIAMRAFSPTYDPTLTPDPTIGAEFWEGIFPIDEFGNSVKLEIWDTAGQESYKPLAPIFFQNSSIAVLVFDVTEPKTIDSLGYYNDILKEYEQDCFIAVVGNKIDLEDERKISYEEGKAYAEKIGSNFYMETSALTGEGVSELFSALAHQKNLKFSQLSRSIGFSDSDNGRGCC